MKLSDYIQGLRKGKEAHRLEKESMTDPFLADAMDGYSQVEGNHQQRIDKLRMQVLAHASQKKKKNTYAITWSIAACLVIGFGISSYFLFLKKGMTDDAFIAKDKSPLEALEPMMPQKETPSLAEVRSMPDSTHEATAKQAAKKDIIAQSKNKTTHQPQSTPVAASIIEEALDLKVIHKEEAEAEAIAPTISNQIKSIVTDEKGAPIEIPVDTSHTMLIAMNEDKQTLNEVVVVGHSSKRKPVLAGSHTTIDSKSKEKQSTPEPSIGKRQYKKYLEKNLVRPSDDSCKDVKGEVVLSFFVDREGKPQNITVLHSLCASADQEAIRLVKEGPKWTFGNLPVRVTVKF